MKKRNKVNSVHLVLLTAPLFLLLLILSVLSLAAQTPQSDLLKGKVISMDEKMFREKVFDYRNSSDQWKYTGERPAVIDFYADWCPPCRMIAPTLKEIAKKQADSLYVYKVNVDENKELAAAMGITSIPTLFFVPLQGQIQVVVGAPDRKTLEQNVQEYLLKK